MTSPLEGAMARQIYKGMKGLFLDATLTRDGANSGPAYNPTTATATVYTCKAIAARITGARGETIEGTGDTKVTILRNSLAVDPEPLDRIAIPSKGISGVIPDDPKAVYSDEASATWECRVVT